jgi:hypothetical protein
METANPITLTENQEWYDPIFTNDIFLILQNHRSLYLNRISSGSWKKISNLISVANYIEYWCILSIIAFWPLAKMCFELAGGPRKYWYVGLSVMCHLNDSNDIFHTHKTEGSTCRIRSNTATSHHLLQVHVRRLCTIRPFDYMLFTPILYGVRNTGCPQISNKKKYIFFRGNWPCPWMT